jgi:rubrerythrin
MEKLEIIERLIALVKLDIDAVNAYVKAVERIGESDIRQYLMNFLDEHNVHISAINAMLRDFGAEPPEFGPELKGIFLTPEHFESTIGPDEVLKALQKGETISYNLYENAVELHFPPDIRVILDKHFRDEIKHKRYIDHAIDIRIWEQGSSGV